MHAHANINTLLRRLLLLLVPVLVAACSGSMSDLQQYVNQVKTRPPEAIEPIPPVKAADTFTYEAHSLRDPFRFEETSEEPTATTGSGPRPDANRRKEYLESFPLDTLQMVGTLSQGEMTWALVQDLDGLVHRVTEGNYLGQNHGRVSLVAADRVELTELVPDGNGGWLQRDATISVTEN
ncbi:MAG: pilus assembly protein PilP [Wenzhouxiangellaceae bacterium]